MSEPAALVDAPPLAPRFARPEDEPALRQLTRACPMQGAVSYCVEREPDFFALTRLQGHEPEVVVVDDGDAASGTLSAMATSVSVRRRLGDDVRDLRYFADLKVHPHQRGRGLARSLMQLARELLLRERVSAYSVVLGSNSSMRAVVASSAHGLRFQRLATIRSYNVFIVRRPPMPSGLRVRGASERDLEQLTTLWNRLQRGRALSPEWTPRDFHAVLTGTPGLGIERVLVAERSGRIVAFTGVWDPTPVKQVRLLGLSPRLRWLRRVYNPVARGLGRPTIPADSSVLRFVYLSHFCAETPADFQALLAGVHDRLMGSDLLYFDVALDLRDPLTPALDGFFATTVDFDVQWISPAEISAPAIPARPVYFELAHA